MIKNFHMVKRISLIIVASFLLFLELPCYGQDKPLAADLIEDGQTIDLTSSRYQKLFLELEEQHNFPKEYLNDLFQGITLHRKVLVLMDKQWEAKPYYQYWPIFITPTVIATGKRKLLIHKNVLKRIEEEIGVEKEIVVAIWAIESRYGSHKGRYNVFRTLNTLFDAYPRRSDFFRNQLIHFLLLCRENNLDPLEIKGSYAGAFGQTQFIPSSFTEYAVDFDKDGKRDVFESKDDVLGSIANYLHSFGWEFGEPIYHDIGNTLGSHELTEAFEEGRKSRIAWETVGQTQKISIPRPANDKALSIVGLEISPAEGGGFRYIAGYPNFQSITEWNHSNRYAMAVTQLAEYLTK